MKIFKLALYVLVVLLLQTVVLARLNLFGQVPNLVFVSIVVFAVLNKNQPAYVFAAVASFFQDILSFGVYFNVISNLLVLILFKTVVAEVDETASSLVLPAVAFLTPLTLIVQAVALNLFWGQAIGFGQLFFTCILVTVYNLVLTPLIFSVLQRISSEQNI